MLLHQNCWISVTLDDFIITNVNSATVVKAKKRYSPQCTERKLLQLAVRISFRYQFVPSNMLLCFVWIESRNITLINIKMSSIVFADSIYIFIPFPFTVVFTPCLLTPCDITLSLATVSITLQNLSCLTYQSYLRYIRQVLWKKQQHTSCLLYTSRCV